MTPATNEELVLVALLALGGDLDLIDIEDVAIQSDLIAPGRFRWRKHKQHINIQTVYKALKDARQNGFARGKSASGWTLTDEGLQKARSMGSDFSITYQQPANRQERSWLIKERQRLKTDPAYLKFSAGDGDSITPREALRFFMLDEYITGELRKTRVDRLVRLFSDDDLGAVVRLIASKVPE
jgi:hypothetical protein